MPSCVCLGEVVEDFGFEISLVRGDCVWHGHRVCFLPVVLVSLRAVPSPGGWQPCWRLNSQDARHSLSGG